MHAGELAALGTATAWTASSLAFESAARRIGSLSLNLIRVVAALGWLTLAAVIVRGRAWPSDATGEQWGYLLASGAVGMVLGDLCTFRAYLEFGARRTMVVSTVTPIFTAALAWAALGERVTAVEMLAMLVIMAGVMLAVRERGADIDDGARVGRGALLAVGGSLGQAGGLLLAKRGLTGYSPIAGTQIRLIAGVLGFAVVLTLARWWPRLRASLADRRALTWTAVGALIGPGLGVTLSLYAVTHAHAGVAAALMALPPVLIIPLVALRGERVGARGLVGAVVAVAGTALIALG
ncbi:MAG: DMT family transporter [Myxococcales bacterium]|nr:DMT family transporter [Myxococcales bacterium]